MWYRIFIPTWRFFDSVGSAPQLFVLDQGQWRPLIQRPKLRWYSLFFNPQFNFFHACDNLLERLVQEIPLGVDPVQLVSYQLVKELAGNLPFKIVVNGEEILRVDV